ncbi:MAG: L-histidine N(alpha)-methyltransferase [Nanoarchaeota archaeon]|nr:L-histidine N(alpha)-methyltransferase [Nanoarchaeota archaeon]
MMASEDYKVGDVERKVLQENIEELRPYFEGDCFDLGSGDGSKLKELDIIKGNYLPLDISPQMIFKSLSSLQGEGFIGRLDDYEEFINQRKNGGPSYLLLGVELEFEPEKLKKMYRIPELEGMICDTLKPTGIPKDDFEFEVEYNYEEKQIEVYMVLKKGQTDNFETYHPEGKRIRTVNSKRYTEEGITDLLEEAGYKTLRIFTDSDKQHALVLAALGENSSQSNPTIITFLGNTFGNMDNEKTLRTIRDYLKLNKPGISQYSPANN